MIQELSVDKLIPNKINPNKMPGVTFQKLKSSLKILGQLNPIIVRLLPNEFHSDREYEIIDGEWRWRASKELGWQTILASIVEATDEQVGKLIMATTIKGKHDLYSSAEIIEGLVDTEDSSTLEACNLDKGKIERRLKYHGSDKIKKIIPGKAKRDEADSPLVKPISEFKRVILLADAPKYCKIEDGKVVLK